MSPPREERPVAHDRNRAARCSFDESRMETLPDRAAENHPDISKRRRHIAGLAEPLHSPRLFQLGQLGVQAGAVGASGRADIRVEVLAYKQEPIALVLPPNKTQNLKSPPRVLGDLSPSDQAKGEARLVGFGPDVLLQVKPQRQDL